MNLLKLNFFTKKLNDKNSLMKINSLNSIEIVFILLIKIIPNYIRYSKI